MRARLAPLCAVLALLLVAVVAASGRSGMPRDLGTDPAGPDPVGSPVRPGGEEFGQDAITTTAASTLAVLTLAAALFGAAIAVVVIPALIRRSVRRRRPRAASLVDGATAEDSGGDIGVRLLRATRSALAELAPTEGGPATDAVIAAWLRLEEAAAFGGTRRLPHQTPTEFTSVALAQHTTDQAAVHQLRQLYHRARFSTVDTIGPAEVVAARAALDRIAATLLVRQP
jgi:hypothetical protein